VPTVNDKREMKNIRTNFTAVSAFEPPGLDMRESPSESYSLMILVSEWGVNCTKALNLNGVRDISGP